MTENASPGQKIRSAREARSWTQDDLARALGTTKATVSRWESDKSAISGGWIGEVSRVLGIPPTDLATRPRKPAPDRSVARGSHGTADRSTLGDVRDAMNDPKHQATWAQVGKLYKMAKKPKSKARENWDHLVKQIDTLLNEAMFFDDPKAWSRAKASRRATASDVE